MKILILGATGFIGNALFNALVREHEIIAGSRTPLEGYPEWRKVDFQHSVDFPALLQDAELVINAIGIPSGDFKKIQAEIPLQLFQYCKEKGIKIMQISAIGAEKESPVTEFLASKKAADDFVISNTDGKVIYPGIVLGKGAKSSQLFKELSGLPVVPLVSDKAIPFVHIRQLTEAVKNTIDQYSTAPVRQFVVGPAQTLEDVFIAMQNKPVRTVHIPMNMVALLFKFFPGFKLGVFDRNMFALLREIQADDYPPVFDEKATDFLKDNRIKPGNHILKGLALLSISFIWIWSGVVSLYSWNESMNLMAAIGITGRLAAVAIIAGSVADIILGVGVFIRRYRNAILKLQIIFILIYTLILTFLAFDYWLHPFGPVAKNIPLIALIYLYYKLNKQ